MDDVNGSMILEFIFIITTSYLEGYGYRNHLPVGKIAKKNSLTLKIQCYIVKNTLL